MSLRIACPNPECRASYSVSEEYEGRLTRCKACGQTFSVLGTNSDGGSGDGVDEIPMVPEPRVGAVFAGRYRVERRLGAGGMGAVFLARDLKLDRAVALKVPHFRVDEDPQVIRRFEREARIAAGFDHPNLCPVFDVGEFEGAHYLTMPCIEGCPLSALVDEGPLDPARAIAIARTIALALAEAHRKGVVHRDLKPSNVLMCERRGPVVVDFGLARRGGPEDSRLTRSGALMGTPSYMAPEQVDGDSQAIGPATDVYALGVLLYELLTGELPFVGPLGSVLVQIKTTLPKPPGVLRSGLDPRLERIFLKAMAKEPGDRFPSMEAMAAALAAVAGPIAPDAPKPKGKGPPRRRSPLPWIGLAAAAFLVVLMGVVVKVRTDRGTVTLDIADPASVGIVMIDGRKISLEALGEPIAIAAGEHELEVTRRDFEVQTRRFSVVRGGEAVVTVTYKPSLALRAPDGADRNGRTAGSPEQGESGLAPVVEDDQPIELPAQEPPIASRDPGDAPADAEEPAMTTAPPVTSPAPIADAGSLAGDRSDRLAFAGERAGQEWSANGLDMAFCWCPAGTFTMGSPPYEPDRNHDEDQVEVTLTKGFWLGKYEITQEQYERLMGANPSWFSSSGGGKDKVSGLDTRRFPVEQVVWEEAAEFCRRLTEQEGAAGKLPAGWSYRLPSEAQWEYGCRAGTTTATAFGDRLSSRQANFYADEPYNSAEEGPYLGRTAEVGQYSPNAWGLHDLHGNVWEWCSDWYESVLQGGADPSGPSKSSARVHRGGAWGWKGKCCRSACRWAGTPEYRFNWMGFRVAVVQDEEKK